MTEATPRFADQFGLDFKVSNDELSPVEQVLFSTLIESTEHYASLDQSNFGIMFEEGIVTGKKTPLKENDVNGIGNWVFDLKYSSQGQSRRMHVFAGYKSDGAIFEAETLTPMFLASDINAQTSDGEVASWNLLTETEENVLAVNTIISALTLASTVLQKQRFIP